MCVSDWLGFVRAAMRSSTMRPHHQNARYREVRAVLKVAVLMVVDVV
jgi:hypothetical protein